MDARHFLNYRCAPALVGYRLSIVLIACCVFADTTAQAQIRMIPTRYGGAVMGHPRPAAAAPRFTVGTANFVVFASSEQEAQVMARAAEKYRKDLAIYWLGSELPDWPERCPLYIHASPGFQASGETQYQLMGSSVGGWNMVAKGTYERVLDSVLPHEITHTIFATHFGQLRKYMPRWADEGACTTVEDESEKRKHRHHLTNFLKTGRGLAFNHMFQLKDYPEDILPLYAQGHSAVQFLIDQSGPQEFVRFIGQGMATENWTQALKTVYQYESIGDFQVSWNRWLADGSPEDLLGYSPLLRSTAQGNNIQLASNRADGIGQASNQVVHASHLAATPSSADVSWYQRRLTEVTGEAPPKYDGRPRGAVLPSPTRSAQPQSTRMAQPRVSVGRRAQPTAGGIEILDWAKDEPTGSAPFGGAPTAQEQTSTTALPGMVPIYR